jgi:hypothetical protein
MWVDVSAGVAGDMLLGALLDSGVSLDAVAAAVDAVVPGAVALSTSQASRAGLRATKVTVSVLEKEAPHRTWREIHELLGKAPLDAAVRRSALSVFQRLAQAEARVHGITAGEVHFHEVGALDAIADVVGTCAAIHELGVQTIVASPMSLGSGEVLTEHGALAVPGPAVLEMAGGWTVSAGGVGELATPTGVALITTLAQVCAALPAMRVQTVGVGAGTRDTAGRANVVRVVIGDEEGMADSADASGEVVLEANVDDLDPRVWPSVLDALMEAGASDAWLSPILMKKGRPAHTLHVLADADRVNGLQQLMITQTSTIGLRRISVAKFALARTWVPVEVEGGVVRIKVAFEDNVIRRVTAEFEDVRGIADLSGVPVQQVLSLAEVAAAHAGLVPGRGVPDGAI